MSVEELRARMVTLESEIELRKKLLAKLGEDKSLVQRQLNAALDPVARLPLEVSSDILLQSLATSPSGEQDVPTVLLRICHAWTDIALATPRLWTTVCIHFPCADHFAEVLPIWFQRARNFPLSVRISLRGRSVNWNHRISDILWRHGGSLRHLEILDDDDIAQTSEVINLFGDITSVFLPLLETLKIRCQYQSRLYDTSQIFEILRRAPNIVESIFHNMLIRDPSPGTEKLVAPSLRRLIFREDGTTDRILRFLSLPALETLSLPLLWIGYSDLLAFLQRSSPPLRDLAAGWVYNTLAPVQLHDCLRLVPSLTRFKMWLPGSDTVTELFAALANTPSLLPNLCNLTINIGTVHDSPISDSSWHTFVRVLSSRPLKQLYVVPVKASPPMDALSSLRELVVGGAKMHIGTEKLNFVVIGSAETLLAASDNRTSQTRDLSYPLSCILPACLPRSIPFQLSSMSIEALRVRIVTLNSEIELQKKLLKKLEKDRSPTQRQLNAALDPVARLPLKVSSEIFLQSLPASPSGKQDVPTVLLHICHAWNNIALATPRLWTTICIHFPCDDNFAEVLPIWFQRAGNSPLSVRISLRGHSINWNHRISAILWRHGGRLRHLEILDDDDIAWNNETIDFLGVVTSVSLPLLETLTIRCKYDQRMYDTSQIFELLRRAPNIMESIFHKVETPFNPGLEKLVVPSLRRLILGEDGTADDILRLLSLPALETLSLPMRNIGYSDLLAFLQRSAAPLQDLAIGWEYDTLAPVQLHDCLRLIPSLTRFKMWLPDWSTATELFAALAESPSLLPNLCNLTININSVHVSDSTWHTLVRFPAVD